MRTKYEVGDRVVYTRDKHSTRPGPRAKNVFATPHGETYEYQVDKYWRVTEVDPNGSVIVRTRRGKRHVVAVTDPRLRPAKWWEKWLYDSRFPKANGEGTDPKTSGDPPTPVSEAL